MTPRIAGPQRRRPVPSTLRVISRPNTVPAERIALLKAGLSTILSKKPGSGGAAGAGIGGTSTLVGAGGATDAQVIVWQDMAGLRTGPMPRFVKRYADLHGVMLDAAKAYADDVRGGSFPAAEHSFDA